MKEVKGTVKKIIFSNNRDFAILSVNSQNKEYIIKGNLVLLRTGDDIIARGKEELHPKYGAQLYVNEYEIKKDDGNKALLKYLSQGAVKGVGPVLASRIVDAFGEDSIKIIEENHERLVEIKGISKRIAEDIYNEIIREKGNRDVIIYLTELGLGAKTSANIIKKYGIHTKKIILDNPYALIDDIKGIGFGIADNIAEKIGIQRDSDFRIKAAVIYELKNNALSLGHMYLPKEELVNNVRNLIGVEEENINDGLTSLVIERKIAVKVKDGEKRIFLKQNYMVQLEAAKKIFELASCKLPVEDEKRVLSGLDLMFSNGGCMLDDEQKDAVKMAVTNGVYIISGGPGTGKTTIIKNIINYLESEGMSYSLAAPTGRAAKRMSEATSREAKTIHRLLEINVGGDFEDDDFDEDRNNMYFGRNEEYPLETDIVIVDEASMIDIYLMNSLLKAVNVGTRLILVGDINQLPSVGAGEVLKDLLKSEVCGHIFLKKIYRQKEGSNIVINAHKIINGESIKLDEKSEDFIFRQAVNYEEMRNIIIENILYNIPEELNINPFDIQILTPTKRGYSGVYDLNNFLQEKLNPSDAYKPEMIFGEYIFRLGDKVIQTKNNYRMKWKSYDAGGFIAEEGNGIYNGDVGIISDINQYSKTVEILYDDNKIVNYEYKDLSQLELAYAMTIHKSQGSEYPAVIIPVLSCPYMLLNRNIIYTGITRAKSKVVIVGSRNEVIRMTRNINTGVRYTSLSDDLIFFQGM